MVLLGTVSCRRIDKLNSISSTAQKPWRLRAGAIAVGFFLLLVWMEVGLWQRHVDDANARMSQLAVSLSQQADDTIELAKLPLASVVAELNDERDDLQIASKVRGAMQRVIAATPRIDSLTVLSADGDVFVSSVDDITPGLNLSNREYFKYHASSVLAEAFVGKPIRSRLTNHLVIPVSQRIDREDGSFGGVVVATISLGHLSDFFRQFDVGRRGSVLLARQDGIVLTRIPFRNDALGMDLSDQPLFTRELPQRRKGIYDFVSVVDGIERVGAYAKSERTQMVVLVAQAKSDLLQSWLRPALFRWCTELLLAVVTIMFAAQRIRLKKRQDENDRQLAAREAEFRMIAEGSGDLIQRLDADFVRLYVSPAAERIMGLKPADMLCKRIFSSAPEEEQERLQAVLTRLAQGQTSERAISRQVHQDGTVTWLETHIQSVGAGNDEQERGYVAVTRDITRQKSIEDELNALAEIDPLTRLANRRAFDKRMGDAIERCGRGEYPVSLLMIDADRFKQMNDLNGHAAGDECLKAIADVCIAGVRRSMDMVARFGGEEIAILLPATDGQGAAQVAESIRAAIEALSIKHEGNAPWGKVTVSVGCSSLERGSPSVSGKLLFELADQALYSAKQSGRNKVCAAPDPGARTGEHAA